MKKIEIDTPVKIQSINNWLDILADNQEKFDINNDVRSIFIQDLIRYAAMDEESLFDKTLKMDLAFEQPFGLNKEYELLDRTLQELSEPYANLLMLAVVNFPDKYAQKMVERIKNIETNKVFNTYTTSLIIAEATKRDLKKTLKIMLEEQFIDETQMIEAWFAKHYQMCSSKLYPLLHNDVFVDKILSKETGLAHITKTLFNRFHYVALTAIENLIDINIGNMNEQRLENIITIFAQMKNQSGFGNTENNKIKQMLVKLMAHNWLEPDTLYDVENKKLSNTGQTLNILFRLEKTDLIKIFELRKEYLSNKLNDSKTVAKKRKI